MTRIRSALDQKKPNAFLCVVYYLDHMFSDLKKSHICFIKSFLVTLQILVNVLNTVLLNEKIESSVLFMIWRMLNRYLQFSPCVEVLQ